MKKTLAGLSLLVLVCALGYLLAWPVPVQPASWKPPPLRGYTGAHAANQKLGRLHHISLKGESGPEHVTIGRDGKVYASVASGNILRMNPDGGGLEAFAKPGGRILGFDFDAAGNLIGADVERGLVSVAPDGKVTVLADKVDGDPIRFADAVTIARNGRMYFSDATTRFSAKELGVDEASLLEILEGGATGRIVEYDPATKKTRVVARGFSFANGVALSADEQSLFVADTGRFRIWKLPLAGNAMPQVLLENLPGYPDNLVRGTGGKLWVGLVKPRNAEADGLGDKPFLRKVVMRLPRPMWPIPKNYGHVVAFTEDGKIVDDLQDPSGAYPDTTGVTETADRLYITSLHGRTLAWLPKAKP
ncbi:MAG: SMP-30/gluconolactonase/LRE family protein [Burkholderiales bacterium]|nr:SMP-30/gluconolactonase/LRE family protein [Burkholderiales bacterium]